MVSEVYHANQGDRILAAAILPRGRHAGVGARKLSVGLESLMKSLVCSRHRLQRSDGMPPDPVKGGLWERKAHDA